MQPRQLSHELREGTSHALARRRWIIGLSLVGAAMGQIVSLYQTGIIKTLPDPPVGPFDSARVDASDYAYKRMRTPDAFLMTASYAMTAALAAADGEQRERKNPIVSLAMGAKILADVALSVQLGREEWAENKALCAYCQVATVCSIASAALALPELIAASQALTGGEQTA